MAHLWKGQEGFSFDVSPDLVNRCGQLVDLLADVLNNVMRISV